MTRRKTLAAGVCLTLVSGCVMLTAEAPLLAGSDPAFVVQPGLWVGKDADCDIDPAASDPSIKSCLTWVRVAVAGDGAVDVQFLAEADSGGRLRVLSASRPGPDGVAPLWVAEALSAEESGPAYVALTPLGEAPFRRLIAQPISCADALDAGPVAGIATDLKEGQLVRCAAAHKDALIAAARSAAIAGLRNRADSELFYVRPE